MKIMISEDLKFKMSDIAVEVLDEYKKTKKALSTIVLEGITDMLGLLKNEGRHNKTIMDFVGDLSAELSQVVQRILRHASRPTDERSVVLILKMLLILINDGCLNEIYYFGGKEVKRRIYNSQYGTYVYK